MQSGDVQPELRMQSHTSEFMSAVTKCSAVYYTYTEYFSAK